jgi:hypothetical protein
MVKSMVIDYLADGFSADTGTRKSFLDLFFKQIYDLAT